MNFIFWPGDTRRDAQLGGKAGALAALQNHDLPIPAWFVLLPSAFDVSSTQLSTEIRNPSSAVIRELNEALAKLCPAGECVAVRSSALDEDGTHHSFAGQLDSFLMVPPAEVATKVAAVWQSAFSERALAYLRQHQLSSEPRPPAVLIQRMVCADVSGVAFGADPISGIRDMAVVSAVRGLGTRLVNGESNADTWHTDHSGKIIQRQIENGTGVLDDEQICAIATLARRTGKIFGQPQDIEWAFENGVLHLLQSRPITTPTSLGPLNIWDNSNIIESYCGVTTPLTFSFARRAYEGVYRQFCKMLAVPRWKIRAHDATFRQMIGLIHGRVYYNLLNWYRVLALLPGFTLNRRFMEQMMGVKEELPAEILSEIGPSSTSARMRDGFNVAVSIFALATNHVFLPRKIRQFYARLNEALATPKPPLETQSSKELVASFLDLQNKLLLRWDAPLLNDFFAMIFYGVLRRLTAAWANDVEGTLQNNLLCGEGGMISAEPAQRIRELAQLARRDSRLVRALCDESLPAINEAMQKVPKFASAYRDYLDKFGDRCLEELKLESLTLHDDPLLLLRSVGQLAQSSREDAGNAKHDDKDTLLEVEDRMKGHPLRRLLFRWVLRHTRSRVRDRENLRFERTRLFARVRRIFVELGRRLHTAGHLLEARDIFYLEIDEVFNFVDGTAAKKNLKAIVATRQREFSDYRSATAPPNRFTTYGDANHATQWSGVQPTASAFQGEQRKGIGCCPGVVRGRVRKIIDPRSDVIAAGEILLAERTDPGWIMLFSSASGILVERGSLLSHSAIVAREMRIPAIVSIDGIMAWLNDGDEVELDGSNGVVRRIKCANVAALRQVAETPETIFSMQEPHQMLTAIDS